MNSPEKVRSPKPILPIVLVSVLVLLLVGMIVALVWLNYPVKGKSKLSFSSSFIDPTANLLPSPTAFLPQPTFTRTPTSTVTRTPTALPSLTPTLTLIPPTETATFEGQLPAEVQITGVNGHAQFYTLDCEARSAVDWADFFGFAIDEYEFLAALPKSDNPDVGFVGEYWGAQGQIPPDSYGVHADPVAATLRAYGVPAKAIHGMTFEQLQEELAAGHPVITWVIFLVEDGTPIEYTAEDGATVIVAHYEHTIIVTGYDADRIALVDGSYVYHRTIEQFLRSWAVLGNMAIIYDQ